MSGNTEKMTVVLDIQGDVSNLKKSLDSMQSYFGKLAGDKMFTKGMKEELDAAQNSLKRLQNLAEQKKVSPIDHKEMKSAMSDLERSYNRILSKMNSNKFEGLQLVDSKSMRGFEKLESAYAKYAANIDNVKEKINQLRQDELDSISVEQRKANLAKAAADERAEWAKRSQQSEENFTKSASQQLAKQDAAYRQYWQNRVNLEKNARGEIVKATDADASIREIEEERAAVNLLVEDLRKIGIAIEGAPKTFEEIKTALTGLQTSEIKQATEYTENFIRTAEQGQQPLNGLAKAEAEVGRQFTNMGAAMKDVDQLRNRLMYFFGIGNTIQLFKRSIRSAYETLKDLDAVMTETAVVTQFDIGQMWEQLPTYVQRANELGLTIHDVYESMTLFYQQGLNTTEATELSTQALKMARIAGLDAATAVDRVTNALRGFNMELNEASATNIADVYSKLAAITASNVDEISTAMTKVASLANNANMSFENTAAFLAQIIESTRESAETAGTALKTVIARFSEVKKLYSEGELLGTDEEGEGIDVNRISTALRTAGLNLNEYLTGMKGLDQIFIDLAAKWDSLSIVQQRYIATQAAGSRQQSRFIALMSDYQRTLQLTEAAQNAAGASEEQYQKTLESLESKLNQLKNAWNEFTMNILNSGFLKGIIDFVRQLLNGINAITGKLPPMLKSFANLGVIFGSLKLGRNLLFGKNGLVSTITRASQGKEIQSIGSRIFDRIFLGFKQQSGKVGSRMGSEIFDKINQAAIIKANEFKKIQAEYSTAFANGTLGMQQYSKVVRESTMAEAAYQAVLAETGMTQEAYDVLVGLGLTNKEKALVLTGLNTGAITLEDLANKDLTKTELLEMLAAKGVHGAKLMLLKDRAENILLLIAEKLGIYDKTAADAAETAGIHAKNTAMLASLGIIGAIIAAIALLIILIVAITKDLKDKTPEARLKKTQERLEALNDTLGETREAINNLKDSVSTFDELQDKVNHTIKGTKEWKEALLEANQQVFDLAKQYPELTDKITIGENGQWTFEDGALDAFYEKQIEQLTTLQNIYTTTLGIENQLTKETVEDKIEKTLAGAGYGNQKDWFEATQKIAELYSTGQIKSNMWTTTYNAAGASVQASDELLEIARANGLYGDIDYIQGILSAFAFNMDDLYNYYLAMADTTNDYTLAIQELFTNDENLAKSGLEDAVEAAVDYDHLLTEATEEFDNDMSKRTQAYEAIGIDTQTQPGKYLLNGKEISKEDARNYGIAQIANQNAQQQIMQMVQSLSKYSEEQRALISRWVSGNLNAQDLANGYNQLGLNISDWKEIGNILGINIVDVLTKNEVNGRNQRGTYLADLTNDSTIQAAFANVSNNVIQGLAESLSTNFEDQPSVAQAILNNIATALDEVPADQQDDFVDAIANLTYGNLDAMKKLPETLELLEIDGDFTELTNILIAISHATKQASINLEDFTSILEKIENGEGIFSNDEKSKLETIGISTDDFIQKGEDEWVYIGENLSSKIAEGFRNNAEELALSMSNALTNGDQVTAEMNADQIAESVRQGAFSGNYQLVQEAFALDPTELDQYNELLVAVAQQYGVSLNKLEEYQKGIQDANKDVREQATLMLRTATLEKLQVNQLKKLTEVISDNSDALDINNKENATYQEAIGKVAKAAQELFGDKFIDTDFVDEHIGLFRKMADGDVSALDEIRKELAKVISETANVPEEAKDDFQAFLDYVNENVDGTHLDVTIDGNPDPVLEAIRAMIEALIAAGMAIDDINEAVEAMGFTIDWDYEYKDIPIYTTKGANFMTNNATGYQGHITSETLVSGYESVPILSSKVIKGISKKGGNDYLGGKNLGGSGGSGGGGGGSEKNDIWENPYDELYNLTEKVNEALRDREKLERDYDRILKNRKATSQELINNSLAEVANLRREIDLQRQLLTGRRKQLAALGSETHADSEGNLRSFNSWGVTKYASYNEKTGLIEIDWAGIDAITDTELGEAVEAYVSRVEELAGQIEDIYDSIEDMSDKIDEIRERNKENYLEFEQRVYDAIVQREQRTIDEYQAISDSIAESNSQIIDSMRESIDLERQIRDNTKTEEDLADKEARLAYLRRDTSGANQTEILKLEQELEEGRQAYQDKLIDQAIDKLDQQNQQAAEQREKQIELMQAQLDWQADHGEFWDETYELMHDAFTNKGGLKMNSDLVELLKKTEEFQGLSKFGQEDWINDMVQAWKEAQEGLYNWEHPANQPEYYNQQPKTTAGAQGAQPKSTKGSGGSNNGNNETGEGGKGLIASLGETLSKSDVKKLQEGLLQLKSKGLLSFGGLYADGDYGWYTEQAVKALQRKLNELTNAGLVIDGLWGKNTRAAFQKSSLKAYKTGGLADFTGPAWLDGSLTRPEMVLNSQDTRNFLSLVDMLRNLAASGQTLNDMSFGDYLFNITVNAELNNDYDVDRLVDRLKDRISSEASYRNINAMSRFR